MDESSKAHTRGKRAPVNKKKKKKIGEKKERYWDRDCEQDCASRRIWKMRDTDGNCPGEEEEQRGRRGKTGGSIGDRWREAREYEKRLWRLYSGVAFPPTIRENRKRRAVKSCKGPAESEADSPRTLLRVELFPASIRFAEKKHARTRHPPPPPPPLTSPSLFLRRPLLPLLATLR